MSDFKIEQMEKSVGGAKRALVALKAANRGQRPYTRNGKPVKGHGEQDGAQGGGKFAPNGGAVSNSGGTGAQDRADLQALAEKHGLRFALYPMMPQNDRYVIADHRNGIGTTQLASWADGHQKVYSPRGYNLTTQRENAIKDIKRNLRVVAPSDKQNAENFVRDLLQRF